VPADAPPLSNHVPMSDPDETQPKAPAESNGRGVLANLPRTRPQRSSPRRAAARARTAAAAAPSETPATPQTPAPRGSGKRAPTAAGEVRARVGASKAETGKAGRSKAGPSKATKSKAAKSKPIAAAPVADAARAPRQGFECESEHSGRTVHPPGGAELVASVAEIVGELAKSGLSTGERLLKDALSRLPLG
jgi:hypothetical protein